jgi:hypothetical protein
MENLVLPMEREEKDRLMAWVAVRGITVTELIGTLAAADLGNESSQERAEAWFHENQANIDLEATFIGAERIAGSDVALNYPSSNRKD